MQIVLFEVSVLVQEYSDFILLEGLVGVAVTGCT